MKCLKKWNEAINSWLDCHEIYKLFLLLGSILVARLFLEVWPSMLWIMILATSRWWWLVGE